MSRTAWNDYAAELAAIRGDGPDQPDPSELDYTPAVPYRGPRAGHEWPGWGGCECGLPWSAHDAKGEAS